MKGMGQCPPLLLAEIKASPAVVLISCLQNSRSLDGGACKWQQDLGEGEGCEIKETEFRPVGREEGDPIPCLPNTQAFPESLSLCGCTVVTAMCTAVVREGRKISWVDSLSLCAFR